MWLFDVIHGVVVWSGSGDYLRISGIATNFYWFSDCCWFCFVTLFHVYVVAVVCSVSGYHSFYVSYCVRLLSSVGQWYGAVLVTI